jgi:ferrous iron transport protein B
MDAHSVQLLSDKEGSRLPLSVLVGNPNVGKSVIFGLLTGRYVIVSNYPGTTVEVASGHATFGKERNILIDTPGVNTLVPMSEDEKVTRDILIDPRLRVVIQIADAKNLRRALVVTLQLAEMGLPVVLALNMHDEAKSRGIYIDAKRLSELLGIDVITTVATQKRGIDKVSRAAVSPRVPAFKIRYADSVELASEEIASLLPETSVSKRALALMILSGDTTILAELGEIPRADAERIVEIVDQLQNSYAEPVGYLINRRRISELDKVLSQVTNMRQGSSVGWAGRFGMLTMHSIWGLPFAALTVWIAYLLVGRLGAGVFVDFVEGTLFGEYLVPFLARITEQAIPWDFARDFLVGPYGVISMGLTYAIGIVLPIVATFFLVFGILEDSGYLPRLAIMSDRFFKGMGLSGKAILPIVLGLGCDTMATLTARVMPTLKERIIVTLLLALAIPCSAQLGVILGMLGGLSPVAAAIWFGVILGVMFLAGSLASKVIPGRSSDFLLEIPPLRVPQIGNVLAKTGARIEWYLREALWIFILGTLVLFFMDKVGALGVIERAAAPVVVRLLSLPTEATDAFIIGFLRRDYGAAGLYMLARQGALDPVQTVVSLVTITLFIPCFANLLMIVKERGLKVAIWMTVFIIPFSLLVGGALNAVLRFLDVL